MMMAGIMSPIIPALLAAGLLGVFIIGPSVVWNGCGQFYDYDPDKSSADDFLFPSSLYWIYCRKEV